MVEILIAGQIINRASADSFKSECIPMIAAVSGIIGYSVGRAGVCAAIPCDAEIIAGVYEYFALSGIGVLLSWIHVFL